MSHDQLSVVAVTRVPLLAEGFAAPRASQAHATPRKPGRYGWALLSADRRARDRRGPYQSSRCVQAVPRALRAAARECPTRSSAQASAPTVHDATGAFRPWLRRIDAYTPQVVQQLPAEG